MNSRFANYIENSIQPHIKEEHKETGGKRFVPFKKKKEYNCPACDKKYKS